MTDEEKLELALAALAAQSEVILVAAGVAYVGFVTDFQGFDVTMVVRPFGSVTERIQRHFDLRQVDDIADMWRASDPAHEEQALEAAKAPERLEDLSAQLRARVHGARMAAERLGSTVAGGSIIGFMEQPMEPWVAAWVSPTLAPPPVSCAACGKPLPETSQWVYIDGKPHHPVCAQPPSAQPPKLKKSPRPKET